MTKNSTAERIYGGFTVSKIRRLIRRAVIFLADFRRTNFWRRIRRSAAAEGSRPTGTRKFNTIFYKLLRRISQSLHPAKYSLKQI